MKRDDYILALTSGLLTADDAAFNKAITYFSQFYELQQPARSGVVSIAGSGDGESPVPFTEWLQSIRLAGVKEVRFYWHFEQTQAAMPAHIEAAFAGSQSLQMQVATAQGVTTWRLRTLFAPQYEMTVPQFVALIDAQQQKDVLWGRVAEEVNESNRLNGRRDVTVAELPDYLQGEGREVYNFLLSQLITEVQVECELFQQPFVIPDALQSLLYKSDFADKYGSSIDYVPVFLYPTGAVSKEALIQLVNAQPFVPAVWEALEQAFADYPPVGMPATGYPAALDQLEDAAAIQELSHSVCRAIATCCEQRNTQPVIPDSVRDCIGPDELDGKRAQARSRVTGGNPYYLESNQQPWELYLFTPVATSTIAATSADVRNHFLSTLQQIEALATRMQSPFAEAFTTARFLLGSEVPAGTFDEAHEARIVAVMQQKGFSEQAIQILKNALSYTKDLHLLQWSPQRVLGLTAVGMADVFGGMGSWNDQDPGEEELEYQRLSTDLFETLKGYFTEVLGGGELK